MYCFCKTSNPGSINHIYHKFTKNHINSKGWFFQTPFSVGSLKRPGATKPDKYTAVVSPVVNNTCTQVKPKVTTNGILWENQF